MAVHGVPRLPPGLVPRERIVERLESPAAIVVAYAPSGFGKTVALTQWAHTTPREGLWMRIRDGMSEPNGLVLQLGIALREFGLIDESNPLRNPADALAGPHDSWNLALRGLRARGRELTLLIDDGERLDDATVEGLIELVADLPLLSLRVATRAGTAFLDAHTAARVGVDVLRQGDLALTEDEVAEMLHESGADADARNVVANGSSPALARLVVLGATHAESGWSLPDAVGALLRRQSANWEPEFSEFVLRTCFADALDASLAESLTGRPNARELLDRAEREGLGYWTGPNSTSRARFVYTPFLRETVEGYARTRLAPEQIRQLVLTVARWERDEGHSLSGVRLAVEQRDWDLVDAILRESWFDVLRTGEELRSVFRGVPLTELRSHPLPTALLAISYNGSPHSRLRALEYFALALVAVRRTRSTVSAVDRTLLRLVETVAYRVTGRLEKAGAVAAEGLPALHDLPLDVRQELGDNEQTIFTQFGVSLLYSGDASAATTSFAHAVSAARAIAPTKALHPLILQAGTLALRGDLPETESLLREIDAVTWPDGWLEGYQGTFFHLARALIALEAGAPDEAEAHIRRTDGTLPANEHWPLLTHVEMLSLLLRNRADEAATRIDSIIRVQRGRRGYPPLTADRLRETRVLIDLARGDTASASRLISRSSQRAGVGISRARIALAEQDPERALRELGREPSPDASSRRRAEHDALKTAALILLDPRAADAVPAIRRLHALLSDRRLSLPLTLVPAPGLDALLSAAADLGDEVAETLRRSRERTPIGSVAARPQLSERERAVARELLLGGTVEEIAMALRVSPNTVKSQLRSIYRKLGVGTRQEAARALSALDLSG